VVDVYTRAEFITQKRSALLLWAQHLQSIISGAERKVIPMRESLWPRP
jgi:hypothetical protein